MIQKDKNFTKLLKANNIYYTVLKWWTEYLWLPERYIPVSQKIQLPISHLLYELKLLWIGGSFFTKLFKLISNLSTEYLLTKPWSVIRQVIDTCRRTNTTNPCFFFIFKSKSHNTYLYLLNDTMNFWLNIGQVPDIILYTCRREFRVYKF